MEHQIILYAEDENNSWHTYKYFSFKNYLQRENHIYGDDKYKFLKAYVYGEKLQNIEDGDIGVNYFRNIGDFKYFCRRKCIQKEIKTDVTKDILEKFLMNESESKRNNIYQDIKNGSNNIDIYYRNEGGGHCEYRPGRISSYDFFNSKGIKISWVNTDIDICYGIVSMNEVYKEICKLIDKGIYIDGITPKEEPFKQFSIFDYISA